MNKVPEPPQEQVVIEQPDLDRLKAWIDFFKKLSPRIRVLESGSLEFLRFYESAESVIRSEMNIQEHYTLRDWPKKEEIAFVIQYDSSLPNSNPVFRPADARVFCFGSYAFGLTYFGWDGDAEAGDWAETFSLADYTEGALDWSYIKKLIVERISELEQQVPEFK